jgi:hypothetical protein
MLLENSRACPFGAPHAPGGRGLRCFSLRVACATKVSGPGRTILNADNARCGAPGGLESGLFGWKRRGFPCIHGRDSDC